MVAEIEKKNVSIICVIFMNNRPVLCQAVCWQLIVWIMALIDGLLWDLTRAQWWPLTFSSNDLSNIVIRFTTLSGFGNTHVCVLIYLAGQNNFLCSWIAEIINMYLEWQIAKGQRRSVILVYGGTLSKVIRS